MNIICTSRTTWFLPGTDLKKQQQQFLYKAPDFRHTESRSYKLLNTMHGMNRMLL